MKRFVLIDGHAILHRAYHALPPLTTSGGEEVGAVFGFTSMLLRVIADLKPEYLAVAFDRPRPTFRQKMYVGYQAKRPKMAEELKGQIEKVYQVLKTLGIPIYEMDGYEADDVIGTLVRQAPYNNKLYTGQAGIEVIIVSGDKDMFQLVGKNIKIYTPVKGLTQSVLYDETKVKAKYGMKPRQLVDFKALVGDPSDNYPGVAGIGPKTAVELLQKFGSLDNIYKNIKKVKPILAPKLKEGKESAVLSKKLATIVTKVPLKLDLKACRIHNYDHQKAQKLFEELEFKSLIGRLPGVKSEGEESGKKSKQIELFK